MKNILEYLAVIALCLFSFIACEDLVFFDTGPAETALVAGKEYSPEHGHGRRHRSEKFIFIVRAKDGNAYTIYTTARRYTLYREGDSLRIRMKYGKVSSFKYGAVF